MRQARKEIVELYEIIKRQKLTIEKVDSGYFDGGIKCYNISKDDKLGDPRREDYPFLYKSIEK
jgi:hypothetical protein